MELKLNLGCGKDIREGYVNIDLHSDPVHESKVLKMDVTNLSEFKTDSVDEILALDIIEHHPGIKIEKIIQEWIRVLKPGGKILIRTPDIEVVCEIYFKQAKEGKINWKRLSDIIYGSQITQYQFHCIMFSFDWLKQLLEKYGVEKVVKIKRSNQNMVVEGIKKI